YLMVLSLLFIFGCSNTKYLAEGELLYTGSSVKVKDTVIKKKDRKELEKELENLLVPKHNKKILGLRPKLWIYNLAGKPKKIREYDIGCETKLVKHQYFLVKSISISHHLY